MRNYKDILARVLLYLILIIFAVIVLSPIVMMLLSSLKSNRMIFASPTGLPIPPMISNYIDIFLKSDFLISFRNSLIVTFSSIIIILIFSSMCAFIIAKYNFFGKNFLYLYFLIGVFIPLRLGTINIVQIIIKLNLYDNLVGLILIYTAMGIPLGVFILTDFIKFIPDELNNAARIDGCSEIGIYYRIIVPLLKPAIITIAIFNFLIIWNDVWWPLLLTKSANLRTIQYLVMGYQGEHITDFGGIQAMLSVATIPIVVFYLIVSRSYMSGLTAGAFKE